MVNISKKINELSGDISPAELARRCNFAHNSAKKYLAGGTPSVEAAIAIADEFGVSLDWLLTGKGEMRPQNHFPSILDEEFVFVPNPRSVRGSAGHGEEVLDESDVRRIAFRRDWVEREMRLDPKRLQLISVVGDSMEPTLRDGELILVDLREEFRIRHDAIYVLDHNGVGLRIKRLARMSDGDLVIKSDNQNYPPERIPADRLSDIELRVVGRVVWGGRRM
ncbi:MAG: helix-turn-helix transcriptional regulator [Magnetococcales bacterium]|nr:helix-turn-helix transcriptional regulator [Magnetococcales bacterium]